MNTLTISLKNIRKNLSFYALYLFSAAFVITVFFAFLSFSHGRYHRGEDFL